jgi:AcrR family transcriptional regulator
VSINTIPNETEQRVLDSALALFSEKGYHGTSIREIIERASVTRPVVYYYFQNKEDLFLCLVTRRFDALVARLDQKLAAAETFRERLETIVWDAFEVAEKQPDVVRLLLHVFFAAEGLGARFDKIALWRKQFGRIVAVFEEGLRQGELASGDSERLALAFSGMLELHVMARVNGATGPLTRALAHELTALYLEGAAAPATKEETCK